MTKISWYLAKLRYFLRGKNHEVMNKYYRSQGAQIGKGVITCSDLTKCDTYCLTIGDDTVISTDVLFVTHDFSISRVVKGSPCLFGKIIIGKNSFVGERATIMYGCNVCDNTIIAAGSVLTHSIVNPGEILGGLYWNLEQVHGKKQKQRDSRHSHKTGLVE